MKVSTVHSSFGPRSVKTITPVDENGKLFSDITHKMEAIGLGFDDANVSRMAVAHGFDAMTPGLLPGSVPTPVQFLQTWLPGHVATATRARKIDQLVGISTVGNWHDEEVVQTVLEHTGQPREYGDDTDIPLSSWNVNYVRRGVVRFEEGLSVGRLEEARAGVVDINTSARKREAANQALDILRNSVGFNGYNNASNLVYGLLNDPGLSAYVNVASGVGGDTWSAKTFLEIVNDINTAVDMLRVQSGDNIDPETDELTLGVASSAFEFLNTPNNDGNKSVKQWIRETYPTMRIMSIPEFDEANGGDDVFYLYAEQVSDGLSDDDGRTFAQIVPMRFQMLGSEQYAKGYKEDYTNALAGIMCKRPYAVVRYTGI